MTQKLRSFNCDDALWERILQAGGSPWLRSVAQRAIEAGSTASARGSEPDLSPSEKRRRNDLWVFWNIYTCEPKRQNAKTQTVASSVYELYASWHNMCAFRYPRYTRQQLYVVLREFGAVFTHYGVQKRISNRDIVDKPLEPLPDDGL